MAGNAQSEGRLFAQVEHKFAGKGQAAGVVLLATKSRLLRNKRNYRDLERNPPRCDLKTIAIQPSRELEGVRIF